MTQIDLPEAAFNYTDPRSMMGVIFEIAYLQVVHGKHHPLVDGDYQPDLMTHTGVYYEIKGSRKDMTCNLQTRQVRANLDGPLRFTIFEHTFPSICSFDGSIEELCAELAEQTQFAVDMPLELAVALYDDGMTGKNKYAYRGSRGTHTNYPESACLKRDTPRRLLEEPTKVMKDLDLDLPFQVYALEGICVGGADFQKIQLIEISP